jgi:hypothetical protein
VSRALSIEEQNETKRATLYSFSLFYKKILILTKNR